MKIKYLFLMVFISLSSHIYSKISDPKPIIINNIKYQSHGNYVEAFDLIDNKLIWKTIVYSRCYPIIDFPIGETDIYWNIISSIEFDNNEILVCDSRNNKYFLDLKNGYVVSKKINTIITIFPSEILLLVFLFILMLLILFIVKKIISNDR